MAVCGMASSVRIHIPFPGDERGEDGVDGNSQGWEGLATTRKGRFGDGHVQDGWPGRTALGVQMDGRGQVSRSPFSRSPGWDEPVAICLTSLGLTHNSVASTDSILVTVGLVTAGCYQLQVKAARSKFRSGAAIGCKSLTMTLEPRMWTRLARH